MTAPIVVLFLAESEPDLPAIAAALLADLGGPRFAAQAATLTGPGPRRPAGVAAWMLRGRGFGEAEEVPVLAPMAVRPNLAVLLGRPVPGWEARSAAAVPVVWDIADPVRPHESDKAEAQAWRRAFNEIQRRVSLLACLGDDALLEVLPAMPPFFSVPANSRLAMAEAAD